MLSSDHDVPLREEEFRLLRDLVRERFGIIFDDTQRETLRSRLLSRLSHLDLFSFEEYYQFLRFAPDRAEELLHMVALLTNNETYFYRERPQLEVFSDVVLRSVRERKAQTGRREIRVLSAGCSTGEEVYTLAMMIYDSGQFFWNWDIMVTGIDVDRLALDKARSGLYFHNSFRSIAPSVLERHFTPSGKGACVKEVIRRFVRFRQANLLEPESYLDLGPVDVILCRNVLIYFGDPSIRKVIGLFHDLLAPGGYLLLGHAESLSRITDAFVPVRFPGTMIYRKPEPAGGPR
jgi:chemotaxis protein methyltransferase CheR